MTTRLVSAVRERAARERGERAALRETNADDGFFFIAPPFSQNKRSSFNLRFPIFALYRWRWRLCDGGHRRRFGKRACESEEREKD